MLVPSDKLVTKPEEGALLRTPGVPGAVEEDGLLSASRLADGLAVDLGPLLRVAVVVAARVGAGEQHGVVGKALAEVRHPSRCAVAKELLLDNLLYPCPSLR